MKSIFVLALILLISLTSAMADVKVKPQRLNDDPKILGYIVIKDPYKSYQKISELANTSAPNLMQGIEEEIGMFLPVLEKSNSIVFVFYFINNDLAIGIYSTVKDKKVFDNILITSLENKEIIDNTLIICENKDCLKIFKDLYPKVNTLSYKNDIDIYFDLKNLIITFRDFIESDKSLKLKPVLDQLEMFVVSLNFTKEPFNQEISLITTENSNLQKMLTQPGIDKITLIDLIGVGNILGEFAQFDLTKAIPFISDTLRIPTICNDGKEETQKTMKEIETKIQNILTKTGTIQFASNLSVDKKTTFTEVIKCQNSKLLLTEVIAFFKKDNTSVFKEFTTGFFSVIQDELTISGFVFNFSIGEKMGDSDVYHLSLKNKEESAVLNDLDYFVTATENYIFLSESLVSLKESVEKSKLPANKLVSTLESFSFFKPGFSSYIDLNLLGIMTAIDRVEKSKGGSGVFLDGLINEKLKPIKIACKMDGNFTFIYNIDQAAIKALAKIVLPQLIGPEEPEVPEEEDSENTPKSQP